MQKFHSYLLLVYFLISLFALQSCMSAVAMINQAMVGNGHKFGAINFDRIPGYVLVNATYRTVENGNVFTCISECRKNKACHSLNFLKKNGSGNVHVCELNELDRYAADSELAFQKQPNSDHYEIKSACRGVICHNGARCASNHKEGTAQCRCPLHYAGKYCENYNPYAENIQKLMGVINNELFYVFGKYNHADGKRVCKAFGARQPSEQDIIRVVLQAKFGYCQAGWTDNGGLGYPEYEGNCHLSTGSTHSGYYSHSCCSDRVTTLKSTWCIKENIDFCKPGWHGTYQFCYMFRDDDLVTMEEAKKKCAARNAVLAKIRFDMPSFESFIKRVCPYCRSMYVGVEKVGDKWSWLPEYAGAEPEVETSSWATDEPRAENDCAAYNTELHVLTTLPCSTLRGYICRKSMFQ